MTKAKKEAQLLRILDAFDLRGGGAYEHEFAYLIDNGMDVDRFISENALYRREKLFKAMDRERERILNATRYKSYEEFEEAFNRNFDKALSRLFAEWVTPVKSRNLIGALPEQIYSEHLKRPNARLMHVAVYI